MVPQRPHPSIYNDSPRPEMENGIVWKCMQEWGISCEAEGDRWRQLTGSWSSEGNNLAPQDVHISELANGEFWQTDFLHDVNQGRSLGFVSHFGRLRVFLDFSEAHFGAVEVIHFAGGSSADIAYN